MNLYFTSCLDAIVMLNLLVQNTRYPSAKYQKLSIVDKVILAQLALYSSSLIYSFVEAPSCIVRMDE